MKRYRQDELPSSATPECCDQPHPHVDGYATRLIRRKAKQLVGQAGLTDSDRHDLEQDLWGELLARWSKFDPARASRSTFVARVIENEAGRILRTCKAYKRRHQRNGFSLDELAKDGEGRIVALSQTLDMQAHAARTGCYHRPPDELSQLRIDVESVVSDLPPRLRDLCEGLKTGTISATARELGLSRTSAYRLLEQFRQRFSDAGLGEYF